MKQKLIEQADAFTVPGGFGSPACHALMIMGSRTVPLETNFRASRRERSLVTLSSRAVCPSSPN